MAVLDVRDVTKTFGAVTAVDGVSFQVGPGEVAGRGIDAGSLAAAAALDLAYVAAALWFFHGMLGAVRRSGGLSRFAE